MPARPAAPRPPESSRILELYDGPTGAAEGKHRLDLSGYRRPDMIGNIYEGKFELAPATGLDNIRYYAQTVADLAARCPILGLESAKHQLLPFVISGMADLVRRFHTGELTQSEVMQMMWGGVVALNQLRSCRYDPRRESRAEAQAQCDQAAKDTAQLGILPSDDAASDTTLFLGRHRCNSEAAQHLARQLVAFARVAHTRSHFPARMPSPTSQEGKAYAAIFENCSRSSLDSREHAWCGCYVRTLHSLKPADQVLQALAQNPFVDASTYMLWVARNVTGGRALYDCSTSTPGFDGWRDGYAPRTTACLIRETPVAGDARECRYRAASGVFTVTSDECKAEISSRQWGYREVDCQAGGVVAAARVGPREWRRGAFTAIDYEGEVDPTFVPPLPPDARAKAPLTVRLWKRDTPGLLKAMALTVLTNGHLVVLGMPLTLGQMTGTDIAAIDREGTLVLQCDYKADKGVRVKMYWFEKTPTHVQGGRINAALQPYFAQIGEGASSCPPRE
jgi:hypothetical protein